MLKVDVQGCPIALLQSFELVDIVPVGPLNVACADIVLLLRAEVIQELIKLILNDQPELIGGLVSCLIHIDPLNEYLHFFRTRKAVCLLTNCAAFDDLSTNKRNRSPKIAAVGAKNRQHESRCTRTPYSVQFPEPQIYKWN